MVDLQEANPLVSFWNGNYLIFSLCINFFTSLYIYIYIYIHIYLIIIASVCVAVLQKVNPLVCLGNDNYLISS